MCKFSKDKFNLLFNKDACWKQTNGLANKIKEIRLDGHAIFEEYKFLKQCAPKRWSRKKHYFVESHDGNLTKPDDNSNRFEEKLAIAIYNKHISWPRPKGGIFSILDYQFPLKASRFDHGIGKIDLLGVTDRGRLTVIELKVKKDGSRRDSPLAAIIQGLRYAAIVEANQTHIAVEAKDRFGAIVTEKPPIIQILAPRAWWSEWCGLKGSTRKVAGVWEAEFPMLVNEIDDRLDIVIECIAFDDLHPKDIKTGPKNVRPEIDLDLKIYPVFPEKEEPIGPALELSTPNMG